MQTNSQKAIDAGYYKRYPIALANENIYYQLSDYFIMLEYHYITYKQSNNIDNWLDFIDRQVYLKDNQEYFGDNVCVFFNGDKVKIINYWDYKAGKDSYCELEVIKLKDLTVEWKWFVIDWEIKMLKGEI